MTPRTGHVTSESLFLPPGVRRALLPLSAATMIPVMVALAVLNQPLQNNVASQGVASLELARSLSRQSGILASWTGPELTGLAFSIGLDFLFVLAYVATFALLCLWLVDTSSDRSALSAKLGLALAYALPIMGMFWVLQNILLAQTVFGHGSDTSAEIIYWCALLKFTVMGVSFGYVVLLGGMQLVAGIFRRT